MSILDDYRPVTAAEMRQSLKKLDKVLENKDLSDYGDVSGENLASADVKSVLPAEIVEAIEEVESKGSRYFFDQDGKQNKRGVRAMSRSGFSVSATVAPDDAYEDDEPHGFEKTVVTIDTGVGPLNMSKPLI